MMLFHLFAISHKIFFSFLLFFFTFSFRKFPLSFSPFSPSFYYLFIFFSFFNPADSPAVLITLMAPLPSFFFFPFFPCSSSSPTAFCGARAVRLQSSEHQNKSGEKTYSLPIDVEARCFAPLFPGLHSPHSQPPPASQLSQKRYCPRNLSPHLYIYFPLYAHTQKQCWRKEKWCLLSNVVFVQQKSFILF